MRTFAAVLLASSLVILTFAQDAANKAASPPTVKPAPPAAPAIPVTAAVVTAPFVLKDGAVSQPAHTDVAGGGKAVFTFTVAKAGNYVIHAIANAPDEDSNSFFLNIDADPVEPLMIWDLDVTKGFEERIVSWRGNGDQDSDEFKPKVFALAAGEHKLIVVGREPGQLKSVSIRPAAN